MNLNAGLEKLLAGKWVAGYYIEDALQKATLLNSKKIGAVINFLGEETIKEEDVQAATATYIDLIKEIKERDLNAAISLKPTQIGLKISYKLMFKNYVKIVKFAKEKNVFVWLDMEVPENIDDTIKAYLQTINYGNTGICIQAYLKRSPLDVQRLVKKKAKIRLVKGAYKTSVDLTFASRSEIDRNYSKIMKQLFESSNDFMVATHDSRIIEEAVQLNKKYKKRFTFAMLNGIRTKYAKSLASRGYKVAIYVPFGRDWVSFAYRRLIEQRHITLIIRSLFETDSI